MGQPEELPSVPELSTTRTPNAYSDADVGSIGASDPFRREELEGFLHDGAWQEGFNEWAENTDLTADERRIALDESLVRRTDFYWDASAAAVGYSAPSLSADRREALGIDHETASAIDDALDDLARTVADMLDDGYVDWGDEAPDVERESET
ncbi:hypothetical protein ACNS7O_17465 (plasmid) [Haloferacaceae archaeon DSL9]